MARCPSNCTERQKKKKQKTIFITFIAMPQLFCQRSRWRGTKGKAGAKMGKGQKMTRRMRAKDTKGATRALLSTRIFEVALEVKLDPNAENSWGSEIKGNLSQKIFTQSVTISTQSELSF